MGQSRLVAAAFAALAWASLVFSLALGLFYAGRDGTTVMAVLGSYVSSFTILANAMAAALLTAVAIDPKNLRRAEAFTAVATYLLVVTLTYLAEFHGALETSGIRMLPDAAIHEALPLLFITFWFAYLPKGALGWRSPFVALAFPLAYLAYMLTRGALTGVYAYPFLDVGALGYGRVALASTALLGVYLVAGFGFLAIDCAMGGGGARKAA